MPIFDTLKRRFDRPQQPRIRYVVAGAHKAGTTWAWAALSQHPQVHVTLQKELHYFDTLHIGVNYRENRRKLVATARKRLGLAQAAGQTRWAAHFKAIIEGAAAPDDAWYATLLKTRHNRIAAGDYSPEYLCLGQDGLRHIKRMMPDCRVVMFIREPVGRMVSALNMGHHRAPSLTAASIIDQPLFEMRGDYAKHIPLWDAEFGDQVLYLPFGRIKTTPSALMAQVETHLGLTPFGGYADLGTIRNSHSGRFEIAPESMAQIEQMARRQTAFLQNRFGAAFCAET